MNINLANKLYLVYDLLSFTFLSVNFVAFSASVSYNFSLIALCKYSIYGDFFTTSTSIFPFDIVSSSISISAL